MRGAVEAHGGKVAKLLGDGVMAVFGLPRVAENDAIRAVRAVDMHRAFRELAEWHSGLVGKLGLRIASLFDAMGAGGHAARLAEQLR